MSAIAWVILIIGALMSLLSLNPIPFVLCLVVALVGTGATAEDTQTVREAGRNPDLPPPPTDGRGVAGCFLWCVVWGVLLLVVVAVASAIVTEGIGGAQ